MLLIYRPRLAKQERHCDIRRVGKTISGVTAKVHGPLESSVVAREGQWESFRPARPGRTSSYSASGFRISIDGQLGRFDPCFSRIPPSNKEFSKEVNIAGTVSSYSCCSVLQQAEFRALWRGA